MTLFFTLIDKCGTQFKISLVGTFYFNSNVLYVMEVVVCNITAVNQAIEAVIIFDLAKFWPTCILKKSSKSVSLSCCSCLCYLCSHAGFHHDISPSVCSDLLGYNPT